jgi:O-acetyl-ADP-ribose deacetylase (regulator of RNase III)
MYVHILFNKFPNTRYVLQRDVERCETDLYNAVINSLSEAEKLKMETIAVSSISSGINISYHFITKMMYQDS